ncbi:MAG: DUF1573 domain-containing protein [Planctomycetota bacterium]
MRRMAWAAAGSVVLGATLVAQVPPTPQAGGSTSANQPRMVIPERMKELGTVAAGEKITVEWEVKNEGSGDLIIDRAIPSCGCTIMQLADSDKIVKPGGKIVLKAEFDSSGRKGDQAKFVTLHSNDPLDSKTDLQFHAIVESLFEMNPPTRLNLRGVRRGQMVSDTLDITPSEMKKSVELVSVTMKDGDVFSYQQEKLETPSGAGNRLRFKVGADAPLGTFTSSMAIKLKIDGQERETIVPIYAEIVADIASQPKFIAPTGQAVLPGKQLTPVTIRSTEQVPFDVVRATAGPILSVTFAPVEDKPKGLEYQFLLTVREDAPPGPFAATLEVLTSSFNQPLVRVPVFGTIGSSLEFEPQLIVLRQDGSESGSARRIRVQGPAQRALEISSVQSSLSAVKATVDKQRGSRNPNVLFIDVRLGDSLPKGTHEGTLTIVTNEAHASTVTIPIRIEVPG